MPCSTEAPVPPSASQADANQVRPVLLAGEWRLAQAVECFSATNPATGRTLTDVYPVSAWPDLDRALSAAAGAASAVRGMPDAASRIADFLQRYARKIEVSANAIVTAASEETGLAVSPRLASVELPRTTDQLRQAAAAARAGDWSSPTIDTKLGLRSCLAPVGPVLVIGPNNFPLALNGISGGDFAAAIAAGNPVIAKAHPLHPTTSRLLAEAAQAAVIDAGLPPGMVQMAYHLAPSDGLRVVRDSRLAAVAFVGGRASGMKLKSAADAAGKLFFAEMSSINPTVLLPGALTTNLDGLVDQFVTSLLMGTGQFCTKPGLAIVTAGASAEAFIDAAAARLDQAPAGVLFSSGSLGSLSAVVNTLVAGGAAVVTGGGVSKTGGFRYQNTLLRVSAKQFLGNPLTFQTEAFGNAALVVVADDLDQTLDVIEALECNLTGTIYSDCGGGDDHAYKAVATALRPKVGRLLNDKMPTGVAVSAAMNHGGRFPATTQPHFSAVGFPGSIRRFTQLESYDNVRDDRLPACLRDHNPTGRLLRQIDGEWSTEDV